jgi:hypothetical protein
VTSPRTGARSVYTATLSVPAKCKSGEFFYLLVRRQVGVRSHMVSFGQSLVGRTRESYNDYDFSHVMKPEKSVNHLSVTCWGESYNSESYNGGSTVSPSLLTNFLPHNLCTIYSHAHASFEKNKWCQKKSVKLFGIVKMFVHGAKYHALLRGLQNRTLQTSMCSCEVGNQLN